MKVLVWQLLDFIDPGFNYISYSAMAEQIRGAAPAEVTVTLLESEDQRQVGIR
jgi:hypothetical protein